MGKMKSSKKSKHDGSHRSQRHRERRCRAHKHCKVELSSEKTRVAPHEGSVDWDVALSDTEAVKDKEGKLLTSFVRKTYIQHIQKSLIQNYEDWMSSHGDGVELSDSFIARCAVQLEQKAVRACMLASLYQLSVVQQIKNIKKSTTSKKLYEDLLTSLNTSNKCDKSCQTDSPVSAPTAVPATPSAAKLSPHQLLAHNYIEQSTPKNPPVGLQSTVVSDTPSDLNFETNLSSIVTMKSYLTPTPVEPQPVPNPLTTPASKFFLSYLPKIDSTILSESSAEVSSSKIYDPEFDSFVEEEKKSEVGSKRKTGFNPYADISTDKKSVPSPKKRKPSFEERLKTFEELFGDTCEDVPAEPRPPDKPVKGNYTKFFSMVSWRLESIAQTCELNKHLLVLPPVRQKSLRGWFRRLFGTVDPVMEITPEQFTLCRKRLANMIVSHLTRYFERGRIGSREVFKALAKEVTRIILNETYAADLEFSQQVVDEIFQKGTSYKTLEDVNALCSR